MTRRMHADERKMSAFVDSLGYDFRRFGIENFRHHLEVQRGRPIHVHTVDFEPDVFGLWSGGQHRDYIFVNRNMHPVQQIHAALHEFAHMLLRHPGVNLGSYLPAEQLAALGLDNPIGHLRSFRHDDQPTLVQQEEEAERFVTCVIERIFAARRQAELYGPQTSIAPFEPVVRSMNF
jgi:hypothetical protein